MDDKIKWRMGDPRHKSKSQLRRDQMVRQYTIELRVDFADEGKYESIEKAAEACAAQWLATARLLQDHAEPQIAILSDDFFRKHEEIKLFANTIEQGKKMIDRTGAEDNTPSEELLGALKNL